MLPTNKRDSSDNSADIASPSSEIIGRENIELKDAQGYIPDVSENISKPRNPAVSDLNFVRNGIELKNSKKYFRIYHGGICGEDGTNCENEGGGFSSTLPSIYSFPNEGKCESSDEEKCEMDWKNIKGIGVNYSSPHKELRRRQHNLEKSILPIINDNSVDEYDNDSFKKHFYGIEQCSSMPRQGASSRPNSKVFFAFFICFLLLAILFYKIYFKS